MEGVRVRVEKVEWQDGREVKGGEERISVREARASVGEVLGQRTRRKPGISSRSPESRSARKFAGNFIVGVMGWMARWEGADSAISTVEEVMAQVAESLLWRV